jgi:putative oxidoreductase
MNARDLLVGTVANSRVTDIGLLVLRAFAGLALAIEHGWGKVPPQPGFVGMIDGMALPAPALFAWLAALAEFAGGLLLAVGLLTRPVAFVIVIHFLVVVLLAHAGDSFGDRELPLFFLVSALLFMLAGAGRYSADGALNRPTR